MTTSPSIPSNDIPNALLGVLGTQRDQVVRLRSLADRQADLIQRRQAEPLLALLGERQAIIDGVRERQEELNVLTQRVSTEEISIPDTQRAEMESLIAEINTGLSDVMSRDEQDEDALRVARDAVRSELSTAGVARQAHQAYQAPARPDTRFADKRG